MRLLALLQVSRLTRFQSTHSLRSATGFAVLHGSCDHSFNPRTPCGVRHGALILNTCQCCFNPRTPCGVRLWRTAGTESARCFNPRTPCGVRRRQIGWRRWCAMFQSTHSLRSATYYCTSVSDGPCRVSIHALLAECDFSFFHAPGHRRSFNPRTPCGVRLRKTPASDSWNRFQSTHSLRSATRKPGSGHVLNYGFNPRTPCGVRRAEIKKNRERKMFQSTHSLRSATAPNLIHCYSTKQIILCANLPKKTVIARLLFLSIYLSIFYSQCITPIADLPGNSCELEVGAQAMFNSL